VSGLGGTWNEIGFDVTAIGMNELKDRQAANMIWAGILAGATVWFSERSLEEAIRAHIPERFLDVNLRALKLGIFLGRDRKER
jgi:Pyruvate/2-oxoacid:ferredoxin oxidoreductase gamma subunit